MTEFYTAIEAALDKATGHDFEFTHHQALFFDFEGAPTRLFDGEGQVIDPDGNRWVGWSMTNADGGLDALMDMKELSDPRDGTSPLLEFRLGFLDETTYRLCRNEKGKVVDRPLIACSIYRPPGEEGDHLSIPPGDAYRLTMTGAMFDEARDRQADGSVIHRYIARVQTKNINRGRSMTEFGAYSDTGQRARSAQLYGIESDTYCRFIDALSGGKTIKL